MCRHVAHRGERELIETATQEHDNDHAEQHSVPSCELHWATTPVESVVDAACPGVEVVCAGVEVVCAGVEDVCAVAEEAVPPAPAVSRIWTSPTAGEN